jgi:hypothetical protein
MIKVALFTPFHPDFGGGAANFHAALRNLANVRVKWFYLGADDARFPETQCLGPQFTGGSMIGDLLRTTALWTGGAQYWIKRTVNAILAEEADAHWVVAMHEGIAIGNQLSISSPKPLHVSVQDDQYEAIATRSRRYRLLTPLMRSPWLRLMRRASGVDVTSDGMQQYYLKERGVKSWVYHPYVDSLPEFGASDRDPSVLRVGHIGSIYSAKEAQAFVLGLRTAAQRMDREPSMLMIGATKLDKDWLVGTLGQKAVEYINHLDEPVAVQRLASCDFVYAQYPFDSRSGVFRRTSFPTKLTSYIKARRSIFAHTPLDSSLADAVSTYNLGSVCAEEYPHDIAEDIISHVGLDIPSERFERAREELYGYRNVQRLEAALLDATVS